MTNLLTPLKLKNAELQNRIVLPPLATEKSTQQGVVTPEVIEHYIKYAEAGVGLIITEHTYFTEKGQASPRQMSVGDDDKLEGMTKLADAIREAGGISCVQINHAGMAGKPEVVGKPVGPSPLPHPKRGGEAATELSKEEIKELVQGFVDAARRVKEAGFDMVEIHSAHGYLICQFNSPLSNQRTDEYGGSLENRFRFAREVVEAVRGEVGPDYPVLFRLGADDLLEGGLTLEDSKKMAPMLVEAGIDCFDLSGGFGGYHMDDAGQGYFTYLTEGLKEVVDVPVICTGGILDPEVADQIIRKNKADLVGIGRQMLKDYNWAKKAIESLS